MDVHTPSGPMKIGNHKDNLELILLFHILPNCCVLDICHQSWHNRFAYETHGLLPFLATRSREKLLWLVQSRHRILSSYGTLTMASFQSRATGDVVQVTTTTSYKSQSRKKGCEIPELEKICLLKSLLIHSFVTY